MNEFMNEQPLLILQALIIYSIGSEVPCPAGQVSINSNFTPGCAGIHILFLYNSINLYKRILNVNILAKLTSNNTTK